MSPAGGFRAGVLDAGGAAGRHLQAEERERRGGEVAALLGQLWLEDKGREGVWEEDWIPPLLLGNRHSKAFCF